MKKILVIICVIFASCLLFSMATSNHRPTRTVEDGSTALIDTLKAKGDTMIETAFYEFKDENIITRIVDSVLKFDPNGSMSLTYYNSTKDSTQYIQQKFRLLNASDIEHMRGVYYNDRIGKPLFIINLEDSDITDLSLSNTGRRVVVPCQRARENMVYATNLGYRAAFFKSSDTTYKYGIDYNNSTILSEPYVADKFKWINSSWSKDSLIKKRKNDGRRRSYKSYYEMNTNAIGKKYFVNDKCDTVFLYGISTNNSPFNTSYTIPLYEFDDSFNGRIIKRLCDSILNDNASVELGILPSTMNDAPAIYITDILNPNRIMGLIINYSNKIPIIIDYLTQESLQEYGIIRTSRTVTIVHTDSWNSLWIDPNSYQAWAQISPEGHLKVAIKFAKKPLDKELAEPFMWLIDQ